MAAKHAVLLFLLGLLFANQVIGFSLSQDEFDKFIKPRCFNRSTTTGQELVLGQNEPIGMSLENVISLIERTERLNPTLKPIQILQMLLRRFHIDGIQFNGLFNIQSQIEFSHADITNAILSDNSKENENFDLVEQQFTEDEKCNLFFSLSHVVNETALENENLSMIYWSSPAKTAKAPTSDRNIGSEVPITTPKPTTLKAAVQSAFIEDNSAQVKKTKRDASYHVKQTRLTKRPREYGVVSYLSSTSNPIAMNRVLLGMYAGFSGASTKRISAVLSALGRKLKDPTLDREIDVLLAVTISDLLGIDTDEGMTNRDDKTIYGADGLWNSTVCNTRFELNSMGNWATMAELRGGIDGYHIGNFLLSHLKENPDITASQLLRFYYSKNGIERTNGLCHRGLEKNKDIKDDLNNQALSYLVMWNVVRHNEQYSYEKLSGYINQVQTPFVDALDKAVILNDDETTLCSEIVNSNAIKGKPVETTVDALFVLDISRKCSPDAECSQAAYVDTLTKNLKLGRNFGSVSVLFNARGVESPNLVDDEMRPVLTPLYSNLYNSTSNECASCKASNYDSTAREVLPDRVELLGQLNYTLANFEEKRANESGVPAKAVFWFDFGTVRPIPSDKVQQVQYERVKRILLYVQRDFTFFGIGTNTTNLKDLVPQEGNLVTVDSNGVAGQSQMAGLAQKLREVPQVFQYGDCKSRASSNYTYQGFITPGFKQYWAMYPDYFRSSSKMQLTFSAESAAIQVCVGRTLKPEDSDSNCRRATKPNEEISWAEYSPCKGKTFENCPPLYFTVAIDKGDSPLCKDARCQNIDQVRWYFSHTGISCSRSYALSISLLLMAITSIVSFVFNRNSL